MKSIKQENGLLVNMMHNLVFRAHLMSYLYPIDIVNVLKTCNQFKDLIESWAPITPETSLFINVHYCLGVSNTNLNRYLFNKQFKPEYLRECDSFKGKIVWLNGQYLTWNTSPKESVFGKYVHLNYVWWLLFECEFIDIPKQHYKVYWRIRRTRNFQYNSDVYFNRDESSIQKFVIDQKKSNDWELVYGGHITPPSDTTNSSTTMIVKCQLKNIDSTIKEGLDVDYVQLIPVSSPDIVPYISMLEPAKTRGNQSMNILEYIKKKVVMK